MGPPTTILVWLTKSWRINRRPPVSLPKHVGWIGSSAGDSGHESAKQRDEPRRPRSPALRLRPGIVSHYGRVLELRHLLFHHLDHHRRRYAVRLRPRKRR